MNTDEYKHMIKKSIPNILLIAFVIVFSACSVKEVTKDAKVTKTPTMISYWNTDTIHASDSRQIELPLTYDGNYDFVVEWGDGLQDTITEWDAVEKFHNYAVAGI